MRYYLFFLLALAGCAGYEGYKDETVTLNCGAREIYTPQEEVEIKREKDTLPPNSIIRTKVLEDWARMRADITAGDQDGN